MIEVLARINDKPRAVDVQFCQPQTDGTSWTELATSYLCPQVSLSCWDGVNDCSVAAGSLADFCICCLCFLHMSRYPLGQGKVETKNRIIAKKVCLDR